MKRGVTAAPADDAVGTGGVIVVVGAITEAARPVIREVVEERLDKGAAPGACGVQLPLDTGCADLWFGTACGG